MTTTTTTTGQTGSTTTPPKSGSNNARADSKAKATLEANKEKKKAKGNAISWYRRDRTVQYVYYSP